MALPDLKDVFHRIRVKLHSNYLPDAGGAYIAKTVNEKTRSIEDARAVKTCAPSSNCAAASPEAMSTSWST